MNPFRRKKPQGGQTTSAPKGSPPSGVSGVYSHTPIFFTAVSSRGPGSLRQSYDPEPIINVEIVERSGPYELITVGVQKFLRIESVLGKTAEYRRLDFQVRSLAHAVQELGLEVSNGEDSEYRAMIALEDCIAHKAESGQLLSDQAEQAWQKYLKLKELSLRPGTPEEGYAAMRAAFRTAINLALREGP